MGYKKNKEFGQKLQATLDLLVSYTPTKEIHQIIGTKFGIGPDGVDRYIRQARKLWAERDVTCIEDKRARALRTLKTLYYEAYQDRKFNICVQVQQEINKLNSVYPKENTEAPKESISVTFVTKGPENGVQEEKEKAT